MLDKPPAGFKRTQTVRRKNYLAPRLDALMGLSLAFSCLTVMVTWVAILQTPFFHFVAGSGAALQYHPVSYSLLLAHPLQASATA